jgi:predicted nucleic acid-binding protein
VDSSAWLAYFFEGHHKEIIEGDETLLISVISIFEITKKLLKENIPTRIIHEKINFLKKRTHTIVVDEKIIDKAVEIFTKYKLPTMDSLIYASAITNQSLLITRDNDFRGLPDVELHN